MHIHAYFLSGGGDVTEDLAWKLEEKLGYILSFEHTSTEIIKRNGIHNCGEQYQN